MRRCAWAFNSGKNALAAVAAACTLGLAPGLPGSGAWSATFAAALATTAFVVADSGLLVALVTIVRGTGLRVSVAAVARVDRMSLCFALAGAAIGFAADVVPWWLVGAALAVLVLAPPHLPRRRGSAARARIGAALVVGAACTGVTVAVAAAGAPVVAVAVVVLFAVGIGVDCVIDADSGALVPAWAVAVVAALSLDSGDALVVALAASGGALLVSATRSPRRAVVRCAVATGLAVSATVIGFAALDHASAGTEVTEVTVAALAASVMFALTALVAGPRRHARAIAWWWTVPMLCVVASVAIVHRHATSTTLAVTGSLAFAACALVSARWGVLPWRSRRLAGRSCSRLGPQALLGSTVTAAVVAWTAALALTGEAHDWAVLVTVVSGDAAVAMVAIGVRQWRLAPRPRTVSAAVLTSAALVVTLAVPATAAAHPWWSGVTLAVVLVVTVVLARPVTLAARRASAPALDGVPPTPFPARAEPRR